MESSWSPPTSSTKRANRPGVSAVARGWARCWRSRNSAATARDGRRSPRNARSVRQDHELHGHATLGGVRQLRVGDGPEADRVDARHLDTVLHEVAPDRFDAALAQLDVVVARTLGVGVTLELDQHLG